ncbi:MAG: ATP-binding protein, partial [Mariprofundus sp.]|nr:ATP-binding protein [Mariprofundus sp.]
MGGLPYGVTEEDFFGGCSVPRNKEIMRVFRDLEIVEHLGSVVPRIVNAYGREAFEIRESYVRIIFRFAETMSPSANGQSGVESGMALRIFALLKAQPLSMKDKA